MKITNVQLFNTPHPERKKCSWNGCKRDAEHHVIFTTLKKTKHAGDTSKTIERLMGLCDIDRGNFRRKYCGWQKGKRKARSGP